MYRYSNPVTEVESGVFHVKNSGERMREHARPRPRDLMTSGIASHFPTPEDINLQFFSRTRSIPTYMNVLQVGTDFVDATNVRNQELIAARRAPVHEASNRSNERQRKWVRPPTEGYADEPILVPASEDEDWEKDKGSDHELESDQEQEPVRI